jgi:hypothetical protein
MGDSSIPLPPEGSGLQVHMRQLTVSGPGTVQQEYIVPTSVRAPAAQTGFAPVYLAHAGVRVITATADTFPAGSWFLINPVGSTIKVAVRSVTVASQLASVLATPTAPRFAVVAFTFTGTASGATVTPRAAQSGFAAATGSLRTANTGLTITRTQDAWYFLPIALATAVNGTAPQEQTWQPPEDEQLVLAAGEGIVLTQATAGTTSDTRRVATNLTWSEYVTP